MIPGRSFACSVLVLVHVQVHVHALENTGARSFHAQGAGTVCAGPTMKELRWLQSGLRPVLRIEPCADDGASILHSTPVIKYVSSTIQAPMKQELVRAGNSRAASSQGRWGWNGGQWDIQWWHTSGTGREPSLIRSLWQACRPLSKKVKSRVGLLFPDWMP